MVRTLGDAYARPVILSLGSGEANRQSLHRLLASGQSPDEVIAAFACPRSDGPAQPEPSQRIDTFADFERTEEGMLRNTIGKRGIIRKFLCNFPVEITKQIRSPDVSDDFSFELRATVAGRVHDFVVSHEEFESMSWILAKCGAAARIASEPGSRDRLREAIQYCSRNVRDELLVKRTGWIELPGGGLGYCHQGGVVRPNPKPFGLWSKFFAGDLEAQPATHCPTDSRDADLAIRVELEDELSGVHFPPLPDDLSLAWGILEVQRLLDLPVGPVLRVAFAAACRAVLGGAQFAVYIVSPTGSFKTTLASLIQQFFGARMDRKHVPASWDSTSNYLMKIMSRAKDMLLLIDDLRPNSGNGDTKQINREADRITRNQGNGTGRGRCKTDGSMRSTDKSGCLPIITCEELPTGSSLLARCVVTEVPRDLSKNPMVTSKLRYLQTQAENGVFAEVFSGFIAELAAEPRGIEAVKSTFANWRDRFRSTGDVASDRQENYPTEKRWYEAERARHPRLYEHVGELYASAELFFDFAELVFARANPSSQVSHDLDQSRRDVENALWESIKSTNTALFWEEPAAAFIRLFRTALAGGRAFVKGIDGLPPVGLPERWGWQKNVRVSRTENKGPSPSRDDDLLAGASSVGDPSSDEADDDGGDSTGDEVDQQIETTTMVKPVGTCIGWEESDKIYLDPIATTSVLNPLASQAGMKVRYTESSLGKMLSEAGLLAYEDNSRTHTVRDNFGGVRRSLLCVNARRLLPLTYQNYGTIDRSEIDFELPYPIRSLEELLGDD